MKEFFFKLYDRLSRQESFVLVSIVSSSGSTPRGDGAKMAVFTGGEILGTIGGGQVEYLSIGLAVEALKEKRSLTRGFNLTRNQTADIGMICGGRVEVCFQYVDGHDPVFKKLLEHIVMLYGQDVDAWMITPIADGAAGRNAIYDTKNGLSTFYDPNGVDELLWNVPDNRVPFEEGDVCGLPQMLQDCLGGKPVLTEGNPAYYVEPLIRSGYTYVFGGGHVAQELVPLIAHLEFKTVVYEDREAFADKALFPGVYDTILGDFNNLADKISMGPKDFAVIMTRGHQCDYEVLSQVLKSPAYYIGVIGSRNKIAMTKERLLNDGFSSSNLDRIHWPIGLDIRSETPAEIAVSIAGEMIMCRAQLRECLGT